MIFKGPPVTAYKGISKKSLTPVPKSESKPAGFPNIFIDPKKLPKTYINFK